VKEPDRHQRIFVHYLKDYLEVDFVAGLGKL